MPYIFTVELPMRKDGLLSIQEAAEFLQLSRPTFNSRRKKLNLSEMIDGNSLLLKKQDLLLLYANEHLVLPVLNLEIKEKLI